MMLCFFLERLRIPDSHTAPSTWFEVVLHDVFRDVQCPTRNTWIIYTCTYSAATHGSTQHYSVRGIKSNNVTFLPVYNSIKWHSSLERDTNRNYITNTSHTPNKYVHLHLNLHLHLILIYLGGFFLRFLLLRHAFLLALAERLADHQEVTVRGLATSRLQGKTEKASSPGEDTNTPLYFVPYYSILYTSYSLLCVFIRFKRQTHRHTHPCEEQCEWQIMTRMAGPEYAVMSNLINTHTHTRARAQTRAP